MSKKRTLYRVMLKSFENTSGFGESPAAAIANLKERVTGNAIIWVMERIKEDDERVAKGEAMLYWRHDTAIAGIFTRYKESLQDNCSYYFDSWEQTYDEERGEWRNGKASTWLPKYEIKL